MDWKLTDGEARGVWGNTCAGLQAKKLVEKYSNPLNCVHSEYRIEPHWCKDCWAELRHQVGLE